MSPTISDWQLYATGEETMFGSVDVFVAQSMPVHGAFNPWWVLLWLALMLGCLLVVAGVTALFQFVAALRRKRSRAKGRIRIPASTDVPANP
jgi:hypothetical protein